MEGFTKLPKIQCFKEGGSVQREVKNFTKRDRKTVDEADTALDKKIVKKAIGMHDKQEHPGEKTDLSKLRKGGRAKKDCGTVKKYKAGGNVTNVYEAKKKSGDIEAIQKVKQIKPTKATAKSAPVGKPANTPAKFCGGKSVKKMADGGMSGPMADANALLDPMRAAGNAIGSAGTALRDNVMGTPEQNRIAKERMDMIAKKKAMAAAAMQGAGAGGIGGAAMQSGVAAGLGGGRLSNADMQYAAQAKGLPQMQSQEDILKEYANHPEMRPNAGVPMQKRGGKVKKSC